MKKKYSSIEEACEVLHSTKEGIPFDAIEYLQLQAHRSKYLKK